MIYQPVGGQTPIEALNNYFSSLYPLLLDIILRILGALVIFFIGWLVALVVKLAVEFLLKNIKLEELFKKAKLDQYFKDFTWEERLDRVLSEIFFWVVFVVFLMVAFDVLGLQIVNDFVRQVVSYIPRAIAGGIILVAGFLFGDLAKKAVIGVFRGLDKKSSNTAASLVKWAIIVFSLIAALNQWGIASDIMTTLVMGLVLFLALAGGLAFGLGGQDVAREILENLRKELK